MSEEQTEEQPERDEKVLASLEVRRILVALDTSTHSMAALEDAARLASLLEAELIGLFVEDKNLLRLASLPFTQEITWPSASGRNISEDKMERDLRLLASQARRALAYAAEEAEAEWSFRVVRGTVTEEVLSAALEADLLSLGRASRPLTKRVRLGSTARAVVLEASGPVLLARKGTDPQQPIAVTFDGSETATRALMAAARMAQANESNLTVLVMTLESDEAPQLAEKANALLDERVAHAEYRHLPGGDNDSLIDVVHSENYGLVVLGGDAPLFSGDALRQLLDELDCPVMLIP